MIVAAAIKIDGTIYGIPAPARHHHIIYMLAERGFVTPIRGEQGFIDDDLGFMSRPQALHRARDEGQYDGDGRKLFSEDLW